MKNKIFYILPLILLFAKTAFANDVVFTAKANQLKVEANEALTITFTTNTNGDFSPPDFKNFNVLGSPQQGRSMRNINGNVSMEFTIVYQLKASKPGKYTIKPATLKANGRTYQSNELVIEVVKASPENDISNSLFVKASVDKAKVYTGEQIIISYKLYTRLDLKGTNLLNVPSSKGFWSEMVENSIGSSQFQQEIVNGVAYYSRDLLKVVAFPQYAGKLEVAPINIECVVRQRSKHPVQTFWGPQYMIEESSHSLESRPLKIEVIPLPEEGKPKHFKGAVGNFSLEATIDKNSIKAHEAINLKVSINGKGNLPMLETPAPTFPVDMEVYDPKLTDKISTTALGVTGTRSFEYLVIPRHAGNFIMEPIEFSYFDPSSKSYKSLASGAFELTVAKSDKEDAVVMSAGRRQEEIKLLGNDIRFISTNVPYFISKQKFFLGSPLFYLLMFLPIGLFGGFLVYYNKRQELNNNPILLKSRNANKQAVKRLSDSKKLLEQNQHKAFYEEIFKALYGYVSDKLHIPVTGLTKENISLQLNSKSVSAGTIQKLNDTISLCEMARFAPINDIPASQVYADAVSIITKIEEEIK